MDVEIDLHKTYTTGEGIEIICYDRSERFTYMCPYEIKDDGSVMFKINETMVYSLMIEDDSPEDNLPVEAIYSFEISADDIENYQE